MSLLDHPDAQALLADAIVTPDQVRGCQDRITTFLQRYLPRFYRAEQRTHAALVIRGLLSGLRRKTCEPIAVEAGVHTASRSRTSSVQAGGTTRRSWPNCAATSARCSATPTRS
jgi:hypothetical protein